MIPDKTVLVNAKLMRKPAQWLYSIITLSNYHIITLTYDLA
jgi:hypothetical protein